MISSAIVLFFVIDPIGCLPLLVGILNGVDASRKKIVVLRECIFALFALCIFYFCGTLFLRLFGIEKQDLSICGGAVLAAIATSMVFGKEEEANKLNKEPFIVPLAIPLIAGPSSISIVIASGSQQGYNGLLSLLIAWVAATIVMIFGVSFIKFIPEKILHASGKLFGLLLMLISCNMILNGLMIYFKK